MNLLKYIKFSNLLEYTEISRIIIVLYFFINIQNIHGENILFFIGGASSHSHIVCLEPLANKLASKGHNITIFGPLKFHSKHPNITKFYPRELFETHHNLEKSFGVTGLKSRLKKRYHVDFSENADQFFGSVFDSCEATLKNVNFKDWLQRSRFDLLIIDKTTLAEYAFAIAHKLNTKKIISYVGISNMMVWDNDIYGIPVESSWIPTWTSYYETEKPSFMDRVRSEFSILAWYFMYTHYYLPKMDKISRDTLQVPDMPPIQDLIQSEAVIFLNSHHSDHFAKSLPPFIVPIGGMHLQQSNGSLPNELENFLEGENGGFIYISFGSVISISTLPPNYIKIFFDSINSLNQLKFLWKWEGEFPVNAPKNVLFRKWFPQADILAHPKIRGFITQGGQVSIQQAIFNAVPLIVLPVNGDQDYNAKRIRQAGNGIVLEFFDLTTQLLKDTITRLLTEESFIRIASVLSEASKNRPLHPLDLAVWWTEFILSQDDVSYLKPGSMNNPWWMTRSLDVYAFVFVLLTTFLLAFFLLLYCMYKTCCKSRRQSAQSKIKLS